MKKLYSAFRLKNVIFWLSGLLVSTCLIATPNPAIVLAPRTTLFAAPAFVLAGTNPFTMTMTFPSRLITGDFDSDGDTDLLYQSGNTQGVGFGYVRNNGGGSYTDFANANSSGTPFTSFNFTNQQLSTTGLFVFDYDNDGDVDIVDRDNSGTNNPLGVWRNDNGTFVLAGTNPFTMTMTFPSRLITGDFDSDGDTDILYQSGNTQGMGFGYVRNNGGGGYTDFANANSSGTPFTSFNFANQQLASSALPVFDYDNDGDVDIVDRDNSGTNNPLGVWRNDNGTFVLAGTNPFTMTMTFPSRLITGDFDSDGDTDLLYQSGNTQGTGFGYVRNNGGGGYTDFANANSSGTPFTSFSFANQQLASSALPVFDYDNDGDVDIVDRDNSGTNNPLGVWVQSGTPPILSSTIPADNATNVSPTTNLTLTFDRSVSKGTGNLLVVQTSNNSITETIPVTDARVTGSGTTWTVNPTATLANSTAYAVRTASGVFADVDGRIFKGIANNTTFNFTTGVACPTITVTNPSVTTATQSSPFSQTFTASGGTSPYSYSLASGSLPTGVTLSSAGMLSGTPTQTGNFPITVRATDANGCGGTSGVYSLTVSTPPTPTIGSLAASPSAVCVGSPVTFTATIGNTSGIYAYTLTNGMSTTMGSSSSTALSQVLTPSGSGVQTFTLTVSANGQSTTATTSVTVNTPSNAGLGNNGPLTCAQTSVTLTASGGTSYTFTSPGGGVLAGSGNTRIVNSPGSYSVTVANASGCVSSTSTTVSSATTVVTATINASPSTTLTCAQTSLTLTAGGGNAYSFSPNVVSQSGNQAVVNASGVYSVTVTNTTSGCFSVTSIGISQDNAGPMASLASSGTLTCAVTSVTLTASPNGLNYTFSGPGIVSQSGNKAIVNASGTYSVTVSNGSNGCSGVASVSVSQNNTTPVATINASPSTTLTCAQTSLTLTAGGGNAYAFSGPGVVSQSGNQAMVNASGTYSVTVTNTTSGCFSTTSITISQDNTAPSAGLASSGTLTCAVTSVTLTASPNGLSYTFSGPGIVSQSGNTAVVNASGTYSVTVTNGSNGCSGVASVSVSQDITPPVATISGSLTVGNGGSTILTASGGTSQTWSTGETTASISVTAGTYSVTVTTANGCSNSTSVTVSPAFGSGALTVLHQDVSFGQTTTNTILPYLQLVNSGSAPIPYSTITVRYWLTVEGNSPITNFQNYYVQLGAANVHERYVPLATPRQGATAYVEYSFDGAAGSLAGGTNSGPIQNGFSKADYSVFNQSDDYSYVPNRDYVANAHITAYVNGFLVYGQEPPGTGPVLPLSLSLTASPNVLTTSGTTTLSATVGGGTTGAPDRSYSYTFSGPGTITPSGNTASVSGIPAGVQTYTVVVRDATSPTSQTISGTVSVTVTQANTAPVATANANQTATVGVAFAYTVNAFTDAETPNQLTYSASINPGNGLSFDPATRIISGTPSMSGVSSVSITATDPGSLSASTSFSITVSPAPVVVGNAQLTVLHQDVSFGQTTTNTILPYLQLVNADSAPIAYSAITVRYWLTVEGNSPITNFQNYYVQIGGNNIHEQYVPLATPRQGATAYVEYSFDAAAGSLAGGTNSGPIQNGFSKADYSVFNQSDDYSYVANRDYVANAHITAYVNGVLVYGQEPPVGTRVGAIESRETLRVQVLGNPLVHEVVEVTVSGAGGQSLLYQLTDVRGHLVSEHRVDQAGSPDHQRLSVVGQSAGVLLLRVSSPTQRQTVKVLKVE